MVLTDPAAGAYCPIPMPDGSDCWRPPHGDPARLMAVYA